MAYVANIVTVAEMQFMAGENRDATGDVEANHIMLQDQAEAFLSNFLQYNLGGTGFSSLDATTRIFITEWAARYGGMQLILFNTTGYGSLTEAEDMVNVHVFRMQQIERVLEMQGVQGFLGVNT